MRMRNFVYMEIADLLNDARTVEALLRAGVANHTCINLETAYEETLGRQGQGRALSRSGAR